MISDMTGGMRRNFPHGRLMGSDPDAIAFADDSVRLVNSAHFLRPGDWRARCVMDRLVAASVIGMPVGVEDLA